MKNSGSGRRRCGNDGGYKSASGEERGAALKMKSWVKAAYNRQGQMQCYNACSEQQLLEKYSAQRAFYVQRIYHAFSAGVVRDGGGLGTPLKTERGGRVFPVSDHSSDIIKAFAKRTGAVRS